MISKDRVRITPYIPRTLHTQLRRHCASVNATEAAVVELALRKHIDGTGEKTMLLRHLDRLGRAIERLEHAAELHMEAHAVWIKLWFAHTPPVPENAKQAARALAETRYKQYVQHLAEQFNGGKRFFHDLPKESIADERELLEAAEDADTEPDDRKKKGK